MVTIEAVSGHADKTEKVSRPGLVRSVLRLLPAFALFAITSASIGLILRVPLDDLGAVVGVPMTIVFLLSRVGVLLVPHIDLDEQRLEKPVSSNRKKTREPSPMFLCGILGLTIGLGSSFLLGLSAGGYRIIGLQLYVVPALKLALAAMVPAVAGGLLLFLDQCLDHRAARSFLGNVRMVELRLFWRVLRTPTILARQCFDM